MVTSPPPIQSHLLMPLSRGAFVVVITYMYNTVKCPSGNCFETICSIPSSTFFPMLVFCGGIFGQQFSFNLQQQPLLYIFLMLLHFLSLDWNLIKHQIKYIIHFRSQYTTILKILLCQRVRLFPCLHQCHCHMQLYDMSNILPHISSLY